jgi:hypothetical protein
MRKLLRRLRLYGKERGVLVHFTPFRFIIHFVDVVAAELLWLVQLLMLHELQVQVLVIFIGTAELVGSAATACRPGVQVEIIVHGGTENTGCICIGETSSRQSLWYHWLG